MNSADVDRNFVAQQGLDVPEPYACTRLTSALLFQPRVIGVWVVLGAVLRSGPMFLALSAVLFWNALVPSLNPFDAVYNLLLGGKGGRPRLTPAPPPRRFSQGIGGTFAAAMAAALFIDSRTAALLIGVVFLFAMAVLIFGRLCVGSFVYYLIRGRADFAMRTLPWGRGDRDGA